MNNKRGLFISFEGGEGAGKSTQIKHLEKALQRCGNKVIVTREPGGSVGAEAVRHVLLSGAAEQFGVNMEAILFAAARNDHVNEVILPALEDGSIVLCDRFLDSSRVYQGSTGELSSEFIETLQRIAVEGTLPALTLIFDIPASEGLSRAKARAGIDATPDRFEKEELSIHEKRREAFLDIASKYPQRCKVIKANQSEEFVRHDVWELVEPLLIENGLLFRQCQ